MSHFPSGYGQWPASYLPPFQTPQQAAQHGQSQNLQSHFPYGHSPSAPTAPGLFSTSQAAFSHNATQIPGLGMPGSGTPSQHQNPWQPPQAYAGYAQQQPSNAQKPPSQPTPATTSNPTAAVAAPKPRTDAMEEGELEEEDFDDLYEPQPAESVIKGPDYSSANKLPQARQANQDAQDDALYGAEPGEVTSNRGRTPARERSGSYSPYLSPREIDLEGDASRVASDAEAGRAQQASRCPSGSQAVKQVANGVNHHKPASTDAPPVVRPASASATALAFKSAEEAKKEAQKSILRLLPLGVKLQTYLDEGFDESIVKSLFSELNLLPASPPVKPAAQPTPTESPTAPEDASKAAPPKAKDQAEERKDRIARLLAAKAAKTASAAPAAAAPSIAPPPKPTASLAPPPAPSAPAASSNLPPPSAPTGPAAMQNLPPPSAPTAPAALKNLPPPSAPTGPAALRKEIGPSPSSKAKSKTDKELLLKKKMEALLKAREAQAQAQQSASAASVAPKTHAVTGAETPHKDAAKGVTMSLPQKPEIVVPPSVSEKPAPSGAYISHDVASPPPMSAQADSIPGLILSTSAGLQQPPSHSSRKRPVAADFVDYNTSVGAPKRPFGQNRQDSFVIDISEDEDSDDDVEMEVDSPAARSPSLSSQHVDTPGRKGPSIKDFPPLSDGPHKRPLSRTNSSGPRPAKLHQLNGEISSLQRRIAELEARKAKKAGSGAQTPDVAVDTPVEFPESISEPASEPTAAPRDDEPLPQGSSQRAVSTSDVDSMDLASAQLISEAASAGLPLRPESKRIGQSKPGYGELAASSAPRPIRMPTRSDALTANIGPDTDRRTRITSFHLPKIEATLLEKKTKLKLLEQKTAQLRLEIEKEAAEKQKLAEELQQLEVEAATNSLPAVSAADVSAPTVPPQMETQAGSENQALDSAKDLPTDDVQVAGAPHELTAATKDDAAAQPMDLDESEPNLALPKAAENQAGEVAPLPSHSNASSSSASSMGAAAEIASKSATESNAEPKSPSQPGAVDGTMDSAASTPESGQIDESEPEQSVRANSDVAKESSAGPTQQQSGAAAEEGEIEDGSPVPAMISDVGQLGGDDAEETQVGADREVHVFAPARYMGSATDTLPQDPSDADPGQLPSFTPYESPLRYFQSYRFHPEYAQNVRGGLRSLTYTNKINPKQALCPNELTKQKCDDQDCGFQHFATIKPKDEQILIELGRADEFAEGEEKNKFIGGLRDVLAAFRAAKVRDYDKIGYGIIEYRRKFIGDRSRVLNGLQDTKI